MKIIITGATGMVGKGVLLECLKNNTVKSVLVINRKSIKIKHPKLEEIIHKDFFDLSPIQDNFLGYDACFFCLGISSFRQREEAYSRITYNLTLNFAKTLLQNNKDLTFVYVSGAGTDNTEKGNTMWARVKGKTENDLSKLGFKKFYAFRPAYIKPDSNTPASSAFYRFTSAISIALHPIIKSLFPKYTTTTTQIGKAMIGVTKDGFEKIHVESEDIVNLTKEN